MSYSDEQRTLARTSPAGLALATNRRWRLTPHLDFVDETVVNAVAGRAPDRIILSVPPRHGKSELVSKHGPAWYLGNFPDNLVMLASYEAKFASSWGRKARDLLEEHGNALYGVSVRPDARAAEEWYLADRQGAMFTAGVGGAFTGKGADLLIIDDPVKNAEDALSETMRNKTWDWWQSTVSTRLHPGAVAIVVMTRWNEDDLAGRLLAGEDDEDEHGTEWVEINIPAIAGVRDPLGREPGGALWPQRFDLDWLERKRREVGSYWFNALYQGRPTPDEGGIFKRHWWSFYPPEWLEDLKETGVWAGPRIDRVWQSWDTALKEKTTSDYTVGVLVGENQADRYLLDRERGRWGLVDAKQRVRELASRAGGWFPRHRDHAKFIENAANGPEIVAALRREIPGLVLVNPDRDKVSRAYAVTPSMESGNVFVPGAPDGRGSYDAARTPLWVQELIDECAAFPNAAHDDQVDALTQALDPRRWATEAKARRRDERPRTVTGGWTGSDV